MTDDSKIEPEDADVEISPEESVDEPENADAEVSSEQSVDERKDVVSEPVPSPSSDVPKKKWHDRKWLLVAIVLIVGVLLGVGIAAPDRQAAKDEAKIILADAKSDASDVKSDAQDDADQIVNDADEIIEDAKAEREELLSGVKKEKADLLESIESSKGVLSKVKGSIRKAKADLASTERTRAQKQKQVDSLNRAIRSSTSLSRENAVAQARDYLDYSSFSCQGLIDQLSSDYGSQYSVADATYAAKEVGLC